MRGWWRPGTDRTGIAVPLLLVSVFCGSCASLTTVTALGKHVYDLTSRELDLGLLGLVEFAPAFLLVVVTGTVADRFDRRRVAAVALFGESIAALALGRYTTVEHQTVGTILALVAVYGVARSFVAPAERSLPADIVRPERLPWLTARNSIAWQSGAVGGPVLAGFLYTANPGLPFLAAAVLLIIGAVAILAIPLTHSVRPTNPIAESEARPPGLHDAFEGFRFIRHQPILLGAISLDLFAVLFGGAVALLPAIAEDRLGVGAVGLGWLRAAGGVGAGLMMLYLAFHPVSRRIGPTLFGVVALFGMFTLLLGVTTSFVVALACMFALSAADAISVYIRSTLVPLVTPRSKRGRVLALENVFIGASNELGAFESGVVGQGLGASGAIVAGGIGTLVVAGLWAALFPALRTVDRFPVAQEGEDKPSE